MEHSDAMPSNKGIFLRFDRSGQEKRRKESRGIGPLHRRFQIKPQNRPVTSFCLFPAWQLPTLLPVVDFSDAFFVNHDLFDDHGALNILLNTLIS